MRVCKNVNITEQTLKKYEKHSRDEERNGATMEKYVRDVRKFLAFLPEGKGIEEGMIRGYKEWLWEWYRVTNANSMLVAIDSFFVFLGKEELKVKLYKIQGMTYSRPEWKITKKDYVELVKAAKADGGGRTSVSLQTIGSTGIRTSELKLITVDTVNAGGAEIYDKGKSRVVLLPAELARPLKTYYRKAGIGTGSIFVTRSGEPMDRSDISERVRQLGVEAGVDMAKVFPHNLWYLFARVFYGIEKDVMRLTGLLGHSNISTIRTHMVTTKEQPRRQMT